MMEFPETPSPSPSRNPLSFSNHVVGLPARCPLPAARCPLFPRPGQTLPSPRSYLPVLPHVSPLYSLSLSPPQLHLEILSLSPDKMAKLTLSLLLLLLFALISFSESLTTSDLPTGDVAGRDLPGGSEAESTATILLPSEKPRSEAATVVPIDQETLTVAEDRPSEPEKIASVPLRTVTFRPYDHGGFRERTVPLSLRFPYRHGGRGCRHGRQQFQPRFRGGEISFGNDMILSGEKPGSDPESRGIERQMPGRWIRVHHRKPKFGYVEAVWKEDKDMMKRPDRHEEREDDEEREHHHRRWKEDKDMMKRPHRPEEREADEDREHHHRRWKEGMDMMKRPHRPEEREDDEEREHHHHRHRHHHFRPHHDHEDEERHGGEGIFKRIRKFLHHF